MAEGPTSSERARRTGRRAGIVVFGLFVTTITAIWSIQIILQVWTPTGGETSLPCRQALIGLITAVERARTAAANQDGGEKAALEQFRRQLSPEWDDRDAVARVCAGDREALRGLREVDVLRYSEEHSIRHEAVDLARRRRFARQLKGELLSRSTTERPNQ